MRGKILDSLEMAFMGAFEVSRGELSFVRVPMDLSILSGMEIDLRVSGDTSALATSIKGRENTAAVTALLMT